MISIIGYAPSKIIYCPECGSEENTFNESKGQFDCLECGLQCYIVEGDDSHAE